jgi:hypothetical protein
MGVVCLAVGEEVPFREVGGDAPDAADDVHLAQRAQVYDAATL